MDRIVDVQTDGLHMSVHRGFLQLSADRNRVGEVALDDIAAIIVHAHGVTWTTNLVVKLAQRGAMMVLCAANHAPVAMMTPIEGHHGQNARFRAQWDAPKPFAKRAWQRIVKSKIEMQASLLAARDLKGANALLDLAAKVRSGDPENIEAQAARRYWQQLLGSQFRRDRASPGANGLLNYGYTVMRALVARSIVAAGLHPTIGLHHANRLNAFALADDLVEPFRPLVDAVVQSLLLQDQDAVVDSETKKRLAELVGADLVLDGITSPVSIMAQKLSQSLAHSFEQGCLKLSIFQPPTPLEWRAIADG